MNSLYICQVHFWTISTTFCEADIQPTSLSTSYRSCYPNSPPSRLVRYFRIAGCLTAILPVELNLTMHFPTWIHCIYARFISEPFRPHFCEADIQPPFLSTSYRSCYPNSPPSRLARYLSNIVSFIAIVPVELILPTIFLYQIDGVYARYISRVLWQNMVRQVTSLGYCLGPTCLVTEIDRQVG